MAKTPAGTDNPPIPIRNAEDLLKFIVERDGDFWDKFAERDAAMQEKVLDLVSQIVDANSVDRVLGSGLHEIAEQIRIQMSPLREIPNTHRKLAEDEDAQLVSLQLALERPDFTQPLKSEVGPLLGVAAIEIETGSYAS